MAAAGVAAAVAVAVAAAVAEVAGWRWRWRWRRIGHRHLKRANAGQVLRAPGEDAVSVEVGAFDEVAARIAGFPPHKHLRTGAVLQVAGRGVRETDDQTSYRKSPNRPSTVHWSLQSRRRSCCLAGWPASACYAPPLRMAPPLGHRHSWSCAPWRFRLHVGVVDPAQVKREGVLCIRIEDERRNVLVHEGGVRPPEIRVGISDAKRDAVVEAWAVRKDRHDPRSQGLCALRARLACGHTGRDRHADEGLRAVRAGPSSPYPVPPRSH